MIFFSELVIYARKLKSINLHHSICSEFVAMQVQSRLLLTPWAETLDTYVGHLYPMSRQICFSATENIPSTFMSILKGMCVFC